MDAKIIGTIYLELFKGVEFKRFYTHFIIIILGVKIIIFIHSNLLKVHQSKLLHFQFC
jgi:uncharacterized membrane protein